MRVLDAEPGTYPTRLHVPLGPQKIGHPALELLAPAVRLTLVPGADGQGPGRTPARERMLEPQTHDYPGPVVLRSGDSQPSTR